MHGLRRATLVVTLSVMPWLAAKAGTVIDDWAAIASPPPPKLDAVSVPPRFDRASHPRHRGAHLHGGPPAPVRRERSAHRRLPGQGPRRGTSGRSQHHHRQFGRRHPAAGEAAPRPNRWVKASVDKFLGTDLDKALAAAKAETVIVCGTAAHGAVLHTATGAAQRKMKLVLPVDCITAEDLFTEKARGVGAAYRPRHRAGDDPDHPGCDPASRSRAPERCRCPKVTRANTIQPEVSTISPGMTT